MPGGRPTDYSEGILDAARFYIDNYKTLGDVIPSAAGLAVYLNLAKSTLYDWASQEDKKEFSDMMEILKTKQEKILLDGGLSNTFNSTITKLVLHKHDYKEKQDVTTDDKPIVNVINYNSAQLSSPELPIGTPSCPSKI